MFFEHRDLTGVVVLDSVVLQANGAFNMRGAVPENPEFYQLRIGNQIAVFSVFDEKVLNITADATDFARSFLVENSPTNDQLRWVDRLRDEATQKITQLERQHATQQIDDEAFIEAVDSTLTNYKTQITQLILANPASAAAYYALFQRIGHYLIFNPYVREDFPMFGAVATSWNLQYPETLRAQHLYDFTIRALSIRRLEQQQTQTLLDLIEVDASLPDIVLPDISGNRVALSSLQGKVVILDFTVYSADFSPRHNMDLNAIYTRFQSRGVEIFQISFDSNEHFWRNAAVNLPWITVRDPLSVNSRLLTLYNISEFPTIFILDRDGDVVTRATSHEEIIREVSRLL
jgi:alkyl hydroperoxide reductase subunit AhpC